MDLTQLQRSLPVLTFNDPIVPCPSALTLLPSTARNKPLCQGTTHQPIHGQPQSSVPMDRRPLALGASASSLLPFISHHSLPQSTYSTHTCPLASASWVTVGNSHTPAGLVLFLRKGNSWAILKMGLKIYLTSQLQLPGPEAAFKDRSCGCDMKAETQMLCLPQQERLHAL